MSQTLLNPGPLSGFFVGGAVLGGLVWSYVGASVINFVYETFLKPPPPPPPISKLTLLKNELDGLEREAEDLENKLYTLRYGGGDEESGGV
jgi:hypothetical protein